MVYKSILPVMAMAAYASLAQAAAPQDLVCRNETSYSNGFPRSEVCVADRNKDGSDDYQVRRYSDLLGNVVLTEIDRNLDGSVDSRTQYGYDIIGRKTLMELDRNNDGSDEVTCSWTYNLENQITQSGCDYNGDGIQDRTTINNYSASGKLIRVRKYAREILVDDIELLAPHEMIFSSRELDLE